MLVPGPAPELFGSCTQDEIFGSCTQDEIFGSCTGDRTQKITVRAICIIANRYILNTFNHFN